VRNEAQHKVGVLDDKAAKEQQQYAIDIKGLARVLEHDRKLKSFMGVKAAPRTQDELSLTQRRTTSAKDQPQVKVKTFEEAFDKIKAATGIQVSARSLRLHASLLLTNVLQFRTRHSWLIDSLLRKIKTSLSLDMSTNSIRKLST
jgi:hypothetical protein